jgi:hypothetical protein
MPVFSVPKVLGNVDAVLHAALSTSVHTAELEVRVTFRMEDAGTTSRTYSLLAVATQHDHSVVRASLQRCDDVHPALQAYMQACDDVRQAHSARCVDRRCGGHLEAQSCCTTR